MTPLAPMVSVLINCYNSETYLKEAIDSVYAQTYPVWEIVFWDNASTDGSAEIAHSYDGRLKYFRSERTTSLGSARNEALRQAHGEFVAFLDCDDLWHPSKLDKQVKLFEDPSVGLVFSDVVKFNSKGETQLIYETIPFYTGKCFRRLLEDYFLLISSVVVRKSALQDLNYWFDDRFSYVEEADLFMRLALSHNFAMVNEPLASFRVHGASITSKNFELHYYEVLQMLDAYEKDITDFSKLYREQIDRRKLAVSVSHAYFLWRTFNASGARMVLRDFRLNDYRAFALYYLTFLPERIFRTLLKIFRRNKIGA